jgi:glucans biosynthesis protein C
LPDILKTEFMNERRYDLDWLRVIAILLLHLFHCAMPFVAEWDWHIKNKETSNLLMECNYFLSKWRMPLLFFISGIGTTFVLNQFTTNQYFRQRTKRLFVPLLFGIFLVVPPQIYFERIFKGIQYTSYFEFYPSIFTTGVYPNGNFSWHHLWFIAYLFIYSILAIPLFLFLKSKNGKDLVKFVADVPKGLGLYGLGLLLYIASFLYFWFPAETHALIDDWAGFTRYFLYFIFGYFVGMNSIFWNEIEKNRKLNLKLAFFSTVAINFFRWNDIEPQWGLNLPNLLFLGLIVFNAWFWVLAILGYGKKHLNFNNKLLQYANEAIYPFYVLHQTFIVIITYYVVQVNESIISKYLFLTFVSFILSMAVYDFLIKPYNLVRILFGMKSK